MLRPDDVRAVETVCGCANSLIHLPCRLVWCLPGPSFFIPLSSNRHNQTYITVNLSYFAHRSNSNNDYRNRAGDIIESYARTTVATVVAATLSMSAFSAFTATSLTGAGATFPAPVYAKWADTYQKETGNKVSTRGIGSSGGVKRKSPRIPLISASDAPLSDEKLNQEGLFSSRQ